jgi:hypothetical protein
MTHDQPATSDRFGRRVFIAGTAAFGLLAACGSDDAEGDGSANSATGGAADVDTSGLEPNTYAIIQRYPASEPVLVPGTVRLPFSLNKDAAFVIDGPEALGAQVVDIDGEPIGERVSATRRDVTPAPYYAYDVEIDEPGFYGIVVDGGPPTGANFQVIARGDVAIPVPGDTLAGFDTPTVADPAGVDPICTREPNCDFHSLTLTEALATGNPVAYFVGTPAFCATGSCTPALESLIEVQPEFNDVVFVHAEVYTDLQATEIAPAVETLALSFEPTVFLIGSDGVIVDRVDSVWDTTEIRERLQALTA